MSGWSELPFVLLKLVPRNARFLLARHRSSPLAHSKPCDQAHGKNLKIGVDQLYGFQYLPLFPGHFLLFASHHLVLY